MKKRVLLISILTIFILLVATFLIVTSATYDTMKMAGQDTSYVNCLVSYLDEFGLCLGIGIVLALIFTYLYSSFLKNQSKEFAKNLISAKTITTDIKEYQAFIDIFNIKNAEIQKNIALIEEEDRLIKEAEVSKNEFIANITHEMNTPLTSIKGFAELMNTAKLEPEMQKKAIATILTQSERLSSLVACIINYNEINNTDLPSYDVNVSEIAKSVLDTLMPTIDERNITVETNIETDVVILSRHERIEEIFGNLIRNATKYNKENGKIVVTVVGGSAPFVSVSDTGIGIAEENIGRIFSRFFTVDKSHSGKNGGFGLGLAVVKKLCQKSGWKLTVDSELNVGTMFKIEF